MIVVIFWHEQHTISELVGLGASTNKRVMAAVCDDFIYLSSFMVQHGSQFFCSFYVTQVYQFCAFRGCLVALVDQVDQSTYVDV